MAAFWTTALILAGIASFFGAIVAGFTFAGASYNYGVNGRRERVWLLVLIIAMVLLCIFAFAAAAALGRQS